MAGSTPISFPANSNPISPIERTNTFPHKTSAAVVTQTPLIDMNTPAINAAPVELDSVSVGEERRETGGTTRGIVIGGSTGVASLSDEEGVNGEVLGRGFDGSEQRVAMLASRSKDPSVIVDVPQEPTAEEVSAAKSAEGMVTPGQGLAQG
ncbi:hypothetical protein P153DRAFT_382609 [Dothidotthia symphoricarpi CBS 119687]|uniref:Uncharacterized protein n=1 Tax=Dothidotthia symphoricarpi CBS 119687 TaxID=1392245 RepID=A0A6A6APB9_9PLEO|nr:uncharacterized protein P153DRAFT_382609 [Dothidotthia symphoricarpi CBS 119687]KAF2132988.1 hypothetical protein P153DRAFT_382609 [Dothidotthia symphoricarpi CBS 119687]